MTSPLVSSPPATPSRSPYQLFMLVMCVIALVFLALQSSTVDEDVRTILEYADFAICVVFLADFLFLLATAPDRLKYMRTWGWIDLVGHHDDEHRWLRRFLSGDLRRADCRGASDGWWCCCIWDVFSVGDGVVLGRAAAGIASTQDMR